jgi:hypothetical protein
MRLRHVVSGFLFLMLGVGCKLDVEKKKNNAITQAFVDVASAQAAASAMDQGIQLDTTITGKVHSVGGEIGTWDIVLDKCESGEIEGFFGADFSAVGNDDLRLRYVHDEAAGDIVKIMIPSQKNQARVFNRNDKCKVLEGSIEKMNVTNWTPKGKIRHVKGHVKFDCAYEDKGHVTGEATFVGCH